MKNSLLVLFRDREAAALIGELGYKITHSKDGHPGLMCKRAAPEWGGAFLALLPDASALPPDLDSEKVEELLVPIHSVILAAHLQGGKTPIGF